jgi:Domain of unknown function (DUF1707)
MGMNQGGEPNPSIRASDADRERIVEILREHSAEGRITADEFEDRMAAAYNAKTMGALAELTTDLPVDLAEHGRRQAELARRARPRRTLTARVRQEVAGLASLAVVLTAIWLLSGGGYFWPAWPLGIMAALTLAQSIQGWGGKR